MLHCYNVFTVNRKITLTKAALAGVFLSLFLQFAEISFMAFRIWGFFKLVFWRLWDFFFVGFVVVVVLFFVCVLLTSRMTSFFFSQLL